MFPLCNYHAYKFSLDSAISECSDESPADVLNHLRNTLSTYAIAIEIILSSSWQLTIFFDVLANTHEIRLVYCQIVTLVTERQSHLPLNQYYTTVLLFTPDSPRPTSKVHLKITLSDKMDLRRKSVLYTLPSPPLLKTGTITKKPRLLSTSRLGSIWFSP